MNNSKYHFIAVTKPIALLAYFLANHGGHRFCLNQFSNFQTDKKLDGHQLFCKDYDLCKISILKTFKMVLNKSTNKMEEVPGDISKHVAGNNFLQHEVFVVYEFEGHRFMTSTKNYQFFDPPPPSTIHKNEQ